MSGLPKGWITDTLETFVDVHDSKRKPINNKERQARIAGKSEEELYPYFGATGQAGLIDDYLFDGNYVALGEDGVPFFDDSKHKAYLLNGKSWVNNHAHVICGKQGIDNRFLCYFLNQTDYHGYVNGATRLKLTQANMRKMPLKVAPLNEQIRIANKLDSILAKVDKAQARLDKIPAILKRFRQSVLAAATSGELTKEWREEMGFTKDTWLPTSIDSLSVRAFDGPFGSKLKTADYTDHGIKVARLENIGHLVFNAEKQTFISETKYQELVKNTLEHNDVLFSSFVDEEIRTCLFDERFGTHINKADCFCIRPNQEIVSPEFLMYSLACKHTYEKIKKQVHGATRPRVNLRFLKSFEIAIPNPKEQLVIVDKINQLFSKANKVERQYLEAKARLDRLTQSILAKAFRGELVPQDPNDEPAEKLLERILAEKEQNQPKKATRKRATKAKTAEKE